MGADGGMCWMELRDSSNYDRVEELLKPFWFLTSVDDYHESNIDWIDNSAISAPQYFVGSYGTDQEFDINDLADVLGSEFDEIYPNADPTQTYGQLTFLELVEDLKTRPFLDGNESNEYFYLTDKRFSYRMYNVVDANGRHISKLEEMLWSIVRYSEPEELKEDLGIIADIKVDDWLNELRLLLKSDSFASEETWT